jgi:K+-sensing histidine kinase KdpD
VSTLEERRTLRHLTAASGNSDGAITYGRSAWLDSLASNAFPLVVTLALVWLSTVALVFVNQFVQLDLVPLLYMLPVVFAATRWGLVPGVVAAVVGAAAADFFFYPPLYTFWLTNPQDVLHLALFLFVAIVISNLAARLKDEAITLRRREKEIRELHAFSQGLATCLTSRDLIFAVQDYLSNTLGYRAVLIASSNEDADADADTAAFPQEIRREALKLIAAGIPRSITLFDPLSTKPWLVRVIMPEILGYGAIAVRLGPRLGESTAAVARRIEALLEEATATLKHLKAKESIEQATIDYQTEILRDALIGGVSHELRTPLASILGSCSVLGEMPGVRNDCRSYGLVEGIQDQASHLDDEIRLLLDATRVSAKGILPQKVWTDPTDIIDGAIKQKKRGLTSHRMVFDLMREPPLVHVDPVLIEQALGQLLENAAKYSPAGTSIKIGSRCADGYLELSVTDHGSGMTAEELSKLGTRCFRNPRHAGAASGFGLGLWIASTFISVNDGTLHAASEGPNLGTTISLRLPVTSTDTPEFLEASDA